MYTISDPTGPWFVVADLVVGAGRGATRRVAAVGGAVVARGGFGLRFGGDVKRVV